MCLYPVRNPVLRLEMFGIVIPLIFSTVLYIIPVSEWKIYSGSGFRGDSSSNSLDMRTAIVFTAAIHVSEVTEFLF